MIGLSRGKKKASLFQLLLIAMVVGTSIYLPASFVLDYYDRRDEVTLDREKRVPQYLKIAQSLYSAGADQELTDFLKEIHAQGDISYFVVYQNGEMTYVEPASHPLAAGHTFDQRAPKAGKDLIDNVRSERSEFLSKDTLLTMGIDKRTDVLWQVIFGTTIWKVILQDILTVIGIASLIFWVHTRDLRRLKKEILQNGRISAANKASDAKSSDMQAVVAGLQGVTSLEKVLQEKNDKLSVQVLPALKRELFSGLTPPYTFDCTLVRTDINGFSQIFNSPYRDRFAKHIDDFFVGLTETVSRYDGLIFEFVGDEAIFYFKDYKEEDYAQDDETGPSTSINRAIDAIRDIHLLARDINTRTQLEGHRFTVKSALAHGTLRFGTQVDGFSLSGGVLIETVRILSTVTDKVDSHLYFGSRHTPYLREDLQTEKVGVFSLKGYSEDVALVRWTGSTPITQHLANVTATNLATGPFDFVTQHRSDFGLETVISAAASARDGWSVKHHLSLVHALRTIQVYRAHHVLAPTLIDWLNTARTLSNVNPEWDHVVSAILMVFPNLVPKQTLGDKEIAQIETFLDSNDGRTVANTISTLTLYDVATKVRPLKGLFANENNRVAANAVIHEGTRELTPDIMGKLEQMILGRGTDDARRASGLYALGEIARILRARDAVYYSTRVDLHRLVERCESLKKHTNESVANQAARAIAKAELAASTALTAA